MLNITGKGSITTCDGITRREFLQVGTLSAIGLSMAQYSALSAAQTAKGTADNKSAIMIFNLGAPSQLDTWDPKPDAPREVRGPFKPMRTKSDEFEITEIFPLHAKIADKFSIVRSCFHTAAAVHDSGHQMMQTGRLFTGGVNTPHAGCALEFLKGWRNELPAHVILPEPMGPTGGNIPHGQDAGFLGKAHDPFVLNADPSVENFEVPDLRPPQEIGEARLNRRRRLREIVDDTVRSFEASPNAELMNANFAAAYRLMTSTRAREAFDLTKEPLKVRERYGMTRFGQCCLLARRLIEAGVRFVTINTFITVFNEITWDIHGSKPFTSITGMKEIVAPMYDQGYSALIEDLHQRGMLNDTLVCNLAEFGRTPKINPAGGRDHWPQCWSIYFAGGGIKGGQVVGKSDEIGAYPVERPIAPNEVVATIYKSLGLGLETHLPGPQSRPFPLVDFGTLPINELFG
ncbi:MAG: hypothetical protein M2R45_00088 [Verrucomicrobia subdivision 3 bacterium]|nr:hypothetical protein [Limisphaerales bacterium]MCS1412454.1 hypothetical protein [Limisphaerales bacterium]